MKPLVICATLLIETSPQALPLGAACIASAIKHDRNTAGIFDVELIAVSKEEKDFAAAEKNRKSAEYIAGRICKDREPAFVCFSVYVWNRKYLEETAKILRQRFPNIKILAGGPEVTASPDSFTHFDYTVSGAGELAMPELIEKLYKKDKSDFPQGVYTSSIERNMTSAKCRAFPPELNTLSSPYLDGTLDPAEYGGALWELARGCPFKCSYCYESKGEKKIQYFPMERIEKELELFNSKKIAQVFVLDPTL